MGRRTVLLIAAIVVAALGTTLVYFYVSRTDERAIEDQQPVEVLVAKTLIKAGTTGLAAERSGSFRLETVPKSVRIEGALTATGAIGDLVAVSDIFPGEQIIQAKFVVPGSAGALPIPSGKVAMSVQLGDPQRVAGFVKPGSDVAIFVTIAVPPRAGQPVGAAATRLLLPRISVLAVGPTTLRPATGTDANKETVPTAILTLSVDQVQAEKLIFASQNGLLYFTLLTKDSKVAPGPGIDATTLFS
ncbi:MAG TPA: Flp pilus assembly protein CpaB [Frankiaceae bacterium]|jgi:pilus assembly protein CpaB|nr:Flp pilus assembly protein CpaB [Frankiaceae bacterium]